MSAEQSPVSIGEGASSAPAVEQGGARLIFPPAMGANYGFTNSASSQFTSEPSGCVREFIQNSLDAALVEKRAPVAKVHFFIEKRPRSDVPGISEYQEALNSAKGRKSNLQSDNVSEEIVSYARTEEVPVLYVADNGIGLNEEKLTAMLSDGISEKSDEGASGSFGNGHLTAFALSRLRYIFYGGVLREGRQLFTGHAMLASHIGEYEGKSRALSKDGFYVRRIHPDKLRAGMFDFAGEGELPAMLKRRMEEIRKEWGSGALIAVVAFNHFEKRKKDSDAEIILRAAASSFFPAIYRKQLEIKVTEHGREESIDRSRLQQFLDREKDKKRGKNDFPSGSRVWNAFKTLQEGAERTLKTSFGDIKMCLREGGEGKRIALCRNGMWITGDLPKLHAGEFAGHVNFDALLLADAETSGEAHTLLKLAETPLHNKIEPRHRIRDLKKRQAVYDLLGEIKAAIKNQVRKTDEEKFSPVDIVPIQFADSDSGKIQNRGQSVKISSGAAGDDGRKAKDAAKSAAADSLQPPPGRGINVKVSSRRLKERRLLVMFQPEEDCEDAELRLYLDGGSDITCSGIVNTAIAITDIGSSSIPEDSIKLIKSEGKAVAARIGEWKKERIYQIRIGYELPRGVSGEHAVAVGLSHRKKPAGGQHD